MTRDKLEYVALTILTMTGSARRGSIHTFLLEQAEGALRDRGVDVRRFRIDDAPHYNVDHDTGENEWASALRRSVLAADGVVLASPSFNSNVPSTVKALIDWLSRPIGQSAIAGKRLAVITASPGPGAGMPAADYIIKLAGFMKAQIVTPGTHVGRSSESIDVDAGTVDESVRAQIAATVDALLDD